MYPPATDPNYPPYGRGDGSPAAEGPAAFDVAPEPQINVITSADFTRRARRSNRQELGFEPAAESGYPDLDTGVSAAVPVAPIAFDDPISAGADSVLPPDDQNTAVPTVNQ